MTASYQHVTSAVPKQLPPSTPFRLQGIGHPSKDVVPIAERGLAEQPHGGIPRAVVATGEPAPVADRAEGDPDRHTEAPGQVGHRRIGSDHQVEMGHDGRGLGEVATAAAGQLDDRQPAGQGSELIQAVVGLQADQPDARQLGQRGKLGQRERSPAIQSMARISLPDDPDQERSRGLAEA